MGALLVTANLQSAWANYLGLGLGLDQTHESTAPVSPPHNVDLMIKAIVEELAPDLIARNSIGHNGAAQLLLTAGDNPDRLKSEASFAALCRVTPVPASSGKIIRHRLNRGGDRAATHRFRTQYNMQI